mmetsp:Transcript_107906/g.247366  ORF Transcript_107906/g.247366 Transcript_107906/m.247366 type:complete len:268 (+) Transcript_107906:60-863(+)|eukprot:CAMPEP_0204319426 /NCGR_PEP_ID=MMETSP0469-20131031/7090_1 /ASSEMBLY_ACC=CAM_ASM_000384 /TAXON_ID=2969 /ORGANISM="Oxyrrhis marina" /LENGTH=267 /DNA_ID=CAMNT_0051300601 /DNA_START=47 /DNA_END=850 /DNA_ORIENTATION=+
MQGSEFMLAGMFVVMAVSNVLAMKRAFGGKDNKEISDTHPTYLSPDGKTFAVWGMIYTMELVMVIAQLFPSDTTEEIFARKCPITGLDVRERLMLAFALNAFWLPVFNNEFYLGAFVVIIGYLTFLISAYTDLAPTTLPGVMQVILFSVGVSLNTSWVLVATFVNFVLYAGELGWKTNSVAGNVPAACGIVAFVGYLGCVQAFMGYDFAWAFVAAWACMGIKRMQIIPEQTRFPVKALSSTLANCAQYTAFAVILAMGAAVVKMAIA